MSKGLNDFLQKNKRLLATHLIALGLLLLGFVLCRYAFFGLHGMGEWPFDLLIAGLVVLILTLLARKTYAPWFISLGYFLGFWLGVLFHKEGLDPGGGKTDNLWQIWTIAFFVCIVVGFIFELVLKWQRLLKKHRK